MEKTWPCKVNFSDGRCPDGCCGYVHAKVTSPTGRSVELDHMAIPAGARERIIKAIVAADWDRRDYGTRVDLSGEAIVPLSKSELTTILEKEGACYV